VSVALGDLNGDGKLDVVAANHCVDSACEGDGSAGVLLGNGDGTFQTAVSHDSGGWTPYSVAVVDMNADGRLLRT